MEAKAGQENTIDGNEADGTEPGQNQEESRDILKRWSGLN